MPGCFAVTVRVALSSFESHYVVVDDWRYILLSVSDTSRSLPATIDGAFFFKSVNFG